jgi:hypothetical protein
MCFVRFRLLSACSEAIAELHFVCTYYTAVTHSSEHANAAFIKVLHQGIVRVICTAQHLVSGMHTLYS